MFQYVDSGLDNVYLANRFTVRKTQHGESIAIHDLNGLHQLIGTNIVESSRVLSGAEFRFLRIELDLPQKQLANLMDVSETTLRNWEKDRNVIPSPAAAVLRSLYLESIDQDSDLHPLLEKISGLNRELHHAELKLEETDEGWKLAA